MSVQLKEELTYAAIMVNLIVIIIAQYFILCVESSLRSFVSVQVGNAQLRTHTVSYTADPIWDKTFSL